MCLLASCDSGSLGDPPSDPGAAAEETFIYLTVYFGLNEARLAEAPLENPADVRYITDAGRNIIRPKVSPDGSWLLATIGTAHGGAFLVPTSGATEFIELTGATDPYMSFWAGSGEIFQSFLGGGIASCCRRFSHLNVASNRTSGTVDNYNLFGRTGDSLVVLGNDHGSGDRQFYFMNSDGSWKEKWANPALEENNAALNPLRFISGDYTSDQRQVAVQYRIASGSPQNADGNHIGVAQSNGRSLSTISTTGRASHPVWGPGSSVLWTVSHENQTGLPEKSIRIWQDGRVSTLLGPEQIPDAVGVEIGSVRTATVVAAVNQFGNSTVYPVQ